MHTHVQHRLITWQHSESLGQSPMLGNLIGVPVLHSFSIYRQVMLSWCMF